MATRNRLGMEVEFFPDKAREQIISAFTAQKTNLQATADVLGVSYVTLWRWIGKLGLREEIGRIRNRARKEGWVHNPFPPGSPAARRRGKASGASRRAA